jgi:hypothetical protein
MISELEMLSARSHKKLAYFFEQVAQVFYDEQLLGLEKTYSQSAVYHRQKWESSEEYRKEQEKKK